MQVGVRRMSYDRFANDQGPTTNDESPVPQGDTALRATLDGRRTALLPIHLHFGVCVRRAFHDQAAELNHYVLRGQRRRRSELKNSRIRVGEPVVLDQVF